MLLVVSGIVAAGMAVVFLMVGSMSAMDAARPSRFESAECTVKEHRTSWWGSGGHTAVAVVTVGGYTVEIESGVFVDNTTALASLAARFPINTTHSCFVAEIPFSAVPLAKWEVAGESAAIALACAMFSLLGVDIVAVAVVLLFRCRHARIAAAAQLDNAEAARLEALRASCSEPPQPADAALRVAAEEPPRRANHVVDFV